MDLLPDMIKGRSCHGAVSMGNKMFVIGGNLNLTCEVFDSTSRKFTSIKQMLEINNWIYVRSAVIIGSKILVFCSFSKSVKKKYLIYDIVMDMWKVVENENFPIGYAISCSKIAMI